MQENFELKKKMQKENPIERVPIGVPKLDELLGGGLPKRSTTLVSGPPGSGKLILCYNFLYTGVKRGEKCLFLTLDKQVEGLLTQADGIGLDFQPYIENGRMKFLFLNINKKLVYETMIDEILSGNYDRVVLDSITPLSEMPIHVLGEHRSDDFTEHDPEEFKKQEIPFLRLHLMFIVQTLETSKTTAMITSEIQMGSQMLSRDGVTEYIVDGVLSLAYNPDSSNRTLSIIKMRNTKHNMFKHPMEIDVGGITITPKTAIRPGPPSS